MIRNANETDDSIMSMMKDCEALYDCPVDSDGKPLGPLVGYAGSYVREGHTEHYVGFRYYDLSQVLQWPYHKKELSFRMFGMLTDLRIKPDTILGLPMAALTFSDRVAEYFGCRSVYAEKKTISKGKDGARDEERLVLRRYDIAAGEKVLIGEELLNSASSVRKAIDLIRSGGGEVIGIMCIVNRSWDPHLTSVGGIPIYSLLDMETPKYRQDHPLVREAVQQGKVVWQPKAERSKLKVAMKHKENR